MNIKPKILIVEDEPIIASDIEMSLEEIGYDVIGIEEDAESALQSIKNNKPDLVLLDINLDGDMDGIILAEEINLHFHIPFVFLTSNTDNLTINRVKRTKPAGFIVKPFTDKDLQSNIEIALFQEIKPVVNTNNNEYIFVKDFSEYIKIALNDLMFVKAEDNYSRLFTDGNSFILSQTLKKVETKLPDSKFIRIHRSFIINLKFVDKYKEGSIFIKEHKLPIGRSYQEEFFKKIQKF
ncbi:response regulator [Lutibacter sp.]|uniref:LytR/AlgR family response regulator transcription factor n=1 Tax=Lutibacter sp. TaxID=1925666 RepID=UPI0025BCEC76|nr:response regulator [Lutibacter sp.]MCF6168039.1 response regulator [Lutibacter sp.]